MTKVGRLLCRLSIHKWGKAESTITPLIPIVGMDEVLFHNDDISVETRIRTCERCGEGEVKNVLHW